MPTYDPDDIVNEMRTRATALGWPWILAAAAGALLLIFAWSTWFTIQLEATAVVQRFEAVNRTVGPGLHFKFPDGIERVRRVPTERVLKEEFGFATVVNEAGERTQYESDKKFLPERLSDAEGRSVMRRAASWASSAKAIWCARRSMMS